MRRTRLGADGANVFMKIRQKRTDALEAGQRLLDLSIGEPKGPALESARRAAADAVLSDAEPMHAYQYNGSPAIPDFAQRFVCAHFSGEFPMRGLDFLPIPGIKPILGLLPLACGCADKDINVMTMSEPGYPIPRNWCAYHPRVTHIALPLSKGNAFRFNPADVSPATDIVMTNYPHNPSGQVADADWFRELCQYCAEHDIRLFNDAAYVALSHDTASVTLSEIAVEFSDLSWSEAFTAAKLIANGTGWHVGAMIGSADFIGDIKEVKGKTDAGFVAPMAAGVINALENDQEGIIACRSTYRDRLTFLSDLMVEAGMHLAIKPRAGFYTLWETPTQAFGERITSGEHFNFRMIEKTGIVGVHFGNYLRYAVCADVEAMADELKKGFHSAEVIYE